MRRQLTAMLIGSIGFVLLAIAVGFWHDWVWTDPDEQIFAILLQHPWITYIGCLVISPFLISAIINWSVQPPGRYLVFANETPVGGWADFKQAFPSHAEAAKFVGSLPKHLFWHVVDVQKQEVIATWVSAGLVNSHPDAYTSHMKLVAPESEI